MHDTVSYLLLADAMSLPFLGNLLAAALQSQVVCVSTDVTCEVQGGDQASQDPHLDDSSSEVDTSDDSSYVNSLLADEPSDISTSLLLSSRWGSKEDGSSLRRGRVIT